jgi:hypothetical protein
MFNSDLTANRPAAGIVGRIFIAIDSPYGIFRDTGTAWDQISSAGGGATIYTGDGTLTGTRTISSGGFQLVFNPQTTFFSSLIPSTSASSFAVLGSNTLTFAAGFSSSNIGNVYSANGAINAQIFSGDATFAQANLASAMVNVNKIDFSSGGHTITMTQSTAPGIRAMTGVQNQIQFTGSHNGRITHAAISQNLGFFRESGSTSTLTITNAYSFLINPLDDYGAGFTFTNRWGIYQAGASDTNYFAANVLIGSTTNLTQKLQVTGDAYIKGSGNTTATNALLVQNSAGTQLMRLYNVYQSGAYIGVEFGDGTLVGTNYFNILNSGAASIQTRYIDVNVSDAMLNINGGSGVGNTSLTQTRGSVILGNQNYALTSATANNVPVLVTGSFVPTSGSAGFANLLIRPTINQTGGASGISRGLYISPTLTSAADWRAIEIITGISILAPSTTASATLRVPSGTAPTTPTNGDIWFDGTNLFMRIGGVTKTFTII